MLATDQLFTSDLGQTNRYVCLVDPIPNWFGLALIYWYIAAVFWKGCFSVTLLKQLHVLVCSAGGRSSF